MTATTGVDAPPNDWGRSVGLFGGTFDPPHNGHLVAAAAVAEELALDTMLLVVAGDPWQKTAAARVTDVTHRLAMARLAVAGVPGLQVTDLEVRRTGPSYMVDTVAAVSAPGRRVVLAVGADTAAGLHTWERPGELLASAELVVVERGDGPAVDDPLIAGCIRVSMPRLDISSTDLRERFAAGRPVVGLVPPAVCDYVHHHHLYRVGL